MEEILIHFDYTKNYKSKHRNEIQSAYFGNKSFRFFTGCTYYQNGQLSITITTEETYNFKNYIVIVPQ